MELELLRLRQVQREAGKVKMTAHQEALSCGWRCFYTYLLQYQTSFLISLQSHMDVLLYCAEARNKLAELKSKPVPTRAKIMLLEGVRERLKQVRDFQMSEKSEKTKLDLSSTFFTETKSIINREEEEGLIEQILKKQKIKIELDQQIETSQDDLNEITKIVQTKLEYCESLTARIAQQSKELEEQAAKNQKEAKLNKVKSSPSLFQKIFG